MKSQYDYEIIRDYLHGLTDTKTSQEIGALIKRDETARSIAEGILRLDDEFNGKEGEIESYLEKFHQAQLVTIQKRQQSRKVPRLWLKVAAAVLLLITVGFTIQLLINQTDVDSLIAAELSEPYPASNLFRSDASPTIEDKGYAAYEAGRYDEASRYFDLASAADNSTLADASVYFYHALSQLYAGNYAKATELFDRPAIAESRYIEQARWYRSLALLRLNNKSAAIEVLKEIRKNPGHFKYEAAGELLSPLE